MVQIVPHHYRHQRAGINERRDASSPSASMSRPQLGTTVLFECDAATGEIVGVADAGRTSIGVAVTQEAVWVADVGGYVARVRPGSHDVITRIAVHKNIKEIATGQGAIWVAAAS